MGYVVRRGLVLQGVSFAVLLPDEHAGCLCPVPLFSFALALGEGLLEFLALELEHRRLFAGELPLVLELLTLEIKLTGLHLEQFGLLPGQLFRVLYLLLDSADFLGLLQECPARIPGGDDGEDSKDCGGYGGELGREDERHGRKLCGKRRSCAPPGQPGTGRGHSRPGPLAGAPAAIIGVSVRLLSPGALRP
jgi:hypothetical protein